MLGAQHGPRLVQWAYDSGLEGLCLRVFIGCRAGYLDRGVHLLAGTAVLAYVDRRLCFENCGSSLS